MNLQNIFHELQNADPEFGARISPRRAAIRTFLRGASLTALPLALGGLLQKAYGKTTAATDVLNFALKLECLEAEFYKRAVFNATTIGIRGDALTAFTLIRNHEAAHVKFLTAAIQKAGGTPMVYGPEQMDFTGGSGVNTGPYAAALYTDYGMFLALAQVFEDTGVRAYKGQAPALMADGLEDLLTAALQIHSVEARHAAHIRRMRAARGSADPFVGANPPKPWITGAQTNVSGADVSASYKGEDQAVQGTIALAAYGTLNATTEAFDEPLTQTEVEAIVKPFFKP